MVDGESLFDALQKDPKFKELLQNPKRKTSAITQNKEVTRQDLLKPALIDIERDELTTALTSAAFKKRAQSIITSAGKSKIEAGFAILSDGERLIYTPITTGVSGADTVEGALFRGHASPSVDAEEILELPHKWLTTKHIELGDFRIIIILHSHPSPLPFSNADLESYDELLTGYKTNTRASIRHNLSFGIFSCQYPVKNYRGMPSGARLFMFQGPASSTEYQASLAGGFEQQKAAFEKSGMKVTDITLPISSQIVDFTLLDTNFGKPKIG